MIIIVVLIIAALISYLLLARARATVLYDNGFMFKFQIGKFIKFSYTTKKRKEERKKKEKDPKKKPQKKDDSDDYTIKNIHRILELIARITDKIGKHFSIVSFNLDMTLGLSNAAQTGIMTGVLYAALYSLMGLIDRLFNGVLPNIVVTPNFDKKVFEVKFEGIIDAKVVHIISILIYSFRQYNKIKKGGTKSKKTA